MSIVEDGGSRVSSGLTRAVGYGLMALAIVAALWNLLAPGAVPALAAIVLTAAAIALPAATPELFEVKGRWGSGRGFNGVIVLAPVFVAVSGLQVSLVDSLVPWIAAAAGVVAGATVGLVQMSRPEVSGRGQLVGVLALAVGAVAFGAINVADARFDRADGSSARTTVADKYVSHGRSTSYNLKLAPWGPVSDIRTISVSSSTYDALGVGDQVCLTVRPGALGLAWYAVAPCQG